MQRREKARKALQKLCKENPTSFLPQRYLVSLMARVNRHLLCKQPSCAQARVLYHEAAVLEGADGVNGSNKPSEQRLALLREALEAASQATSMNPASLSSAALRATCVVNVLVEESSLAGGGQRQPGEQVTGSRLDEARCQRIKAEFKDALSACNKSLAEKIYDAEGRTFVEPVIGLSDGTSQTCDPCCLVGGVEMHSWVH